jgi:hypothetical protein
MTVMESVQGFLGAWKLNPAKSRYELGQPPQTGNYILEPEGDKLKVTMQWRTEDGKEFNQVHHGIPDGKEYTYTENPAVDAMSMTLVDAKTLDTAALKDGQIISFARRILSDDGNIMTITMSGKTPQGTDYTNLAIYEK